MTSRFFEIGRIGRARGLDGWVRFLPENSLVDQFLSESPIVYFKNDRGGYQPLRIEEFYAEEKKNQVSFFVKFDMITSRTDAESLNDKGIYSDRFDPLAEMDNDSPDTEVDLSGYTILYQSESLGHVLDTFDTPAHTILEVKVDSGSLLIPFVDEFIEQINHDDSTIICRNLDQLLEE